METKNAQKSIPAGTVKQATVIRREQPSDAVTIGCIIFMTFNTVFALVQALKHKDYDNVFFVLFIYFGTIAIFGCMRMLDRVPRYDKQIRKCVKGAMLVLTFSVMLSTALKFSVGLWFVLVVGVYCTLMFIFSKEEDEGEQISDMKTNKSLEANISHLDKV